MRGDWSESCRSATSPAASTSGTPDCQLASRAGTPPVEEPLDEELFPTEDYYEQVQGDLLVDDWMTPGVIQVAPDMTLAQVCRVLLDEDIHRVFVVARDKLVGVLSTEDVVRLLAAPAPTQQRPELR